MSNLTENEINQIINAEEIRSLGDTLVYVDELEFDFLSVDDLDNISHLLDEHSVNYDVVFYDHDEWVITIKK